jgi:hypothetical protein
MSRQDSPVLLERFSTGDRGRQALQNALLVNLWFVTTDCAAACIPSVLRPNPLDFAPRRSVGEQLIDAESEHEPTLEHVQFGCECGAAIVDSAKGYGLCEC